MTFVLYETEPFGRDLAQIHPPDAERIRRKIWEYLPENAVSKAAGYLRGAFRQYRRLRVGDYRVMFTVCYECRQKTFQDEVGCKSCPGKPGNSVVLQFVRKRGAAYD
jgi:mRNA-degrading endonuclease RelE of RelBE toxin-antitoxin system